MFVEFINKIIVGAIALVTIISGIFSPLQLGTAIPTPVASFSTSLASKITSTNTTMTLVSTSTDDGTSLVNGSIYGFVLDANTASEEFVLGTASSSNIVSMTRGISVVTGNTEIAALKKEHRRGTSVKITDAPVLLVLARILNGDETIPNILKYDNPKTFTASSSLIDKNYADAFVAAGVPDGNYTTFGGFVLATTSQVIAGTATSTATRYLVLPSELTNATSSAKNIIPITKSNGKLDQGFLNLTEGFTFSGGVTSTGAFVNSATTTLSGNNILATTTINNTLLVTGISTFTGTSTFSGIPTLPASNPTTDNQAARKAYVDEMPSTSSSSIACADGTGYKATVGGLVVATAHNTGVTETGTLVAFLGSVASSTTYATIATQSMTGGGTSEQKATSISYFVPKNYYYKVDVTGTGTSLDSCEFFPFYNY